MAGVFPIFILTGLKICLFKPIFLANKKADTRYTLIVPTGRHPVKQGYPQCPVVRATLKSMDVLLKGLNPRQQEAVLTTEGPILILAGPGSGKTRVLAHRVAYLISRAVAPENILAVTFTNKAANEMKMRISALTPNALDNSSIFIGTFHSLAVRILRAHAVRIGYMKNFTIFDEADSLSLTKEVMKELEINPKQFPAGVITGTISRLKNELITPDGYREEAGTSDFFPKIVHKIYSLYQKRLQETNAMDFDDLIMNTCLLFEKHAEILEQYQSRFRYINVDEWQDTNRSQYVLISHLAKKHKNIAVVGDDAQAIYGWRGADFRNILLFEKDWAETKTVILDQNYRSTQIILDAARGILFKNAHQKEKTLWTEKKGGALLALAAVENERAEAEFVLGEMKNLLRKNSSLKDMVVLYRTNAQSRALEEVFLENNFPYKIIGGIRFYQRKEIKDILAYLRILVNPRDLTSLKRIINVPPRGIGKSAFLKYLVWRQTGSDTKTNQGLPPALKTFDLLLEKLKTEFPKRWTTDFLKYLIKTISYKVYLDDLSPNAEERWENVEELVSLAKKYDSLSPPAGVEKLLEDTALVSDADGAEAGKNVVNLMTLHAAKGLEFPIVFMVGLEEGIFPHSRSLFNPAELEEERRLCYVGLTRAKERVFLSFALRRTHFGSVQANPPSRFLSEIPEHLIEVRESESPIEVEPL